MSQPIGLASISAFVKRKGFDVTLFDAHAFHMERKQIMEYVRSVNPVIIGLSVMTYQLPMIVSFLQDIKQILPNCITIVGGAHISAEYRSSLQLYKEIDYAVYGEGEYTMLELLQAIETDAPLQNIKGLAYRQDHAIKINPPRPLIEKLDRLPYPDWSSLPINRYWDVFTTRKNYARIIASRGCPYQCSFCGAHIAMGRTFRKRSVEHIIGELEMLYDHHHVREILFNDSTFNIDNNWVYDICEGILGMNRPLIWRANVRADRLDKKTLLKMKESGCVKVIMGIESSNDQMLKNMKKGETIEQIKHGMSILKEVNMPSDHGFILGMPGETEQSIKKTIEFAKNIKASVVTFSLATPFPGTHFYEQAKSEGLQVDDWSKFDFFGIPYVPKDMTKEKLMKYYRRALRSFYLRPRYLLKRLLEMKSWTNLKINLWYAFRIFQRRVFN